MSPHYTKRVDNVEFVSVCLIQHSCEMMRLHVCTANMIVSISGASYLIWTTSIHPHTLSSTGTLTVIIQLKVCDDTTCSGWVSDAAMWLILVVKWCKHPVHISGIMLLLPLPHSPSLFSLRFHLLLLMHPVCKKKETFSVVLHHESAKPETGDKQNNYLT